MQIRAPCLVEFGGKQYTEKCFLKLFKELNTKNSQGGLRELWMKQRTISQSSGG